MPRYRLTTPEQVCFAYQIAGLATRAMAFLIDLIIMVVFMLVLVIFVPPMQSVFSAIIFLLASFAVIVGYFIFFEVLWSGRTPGKRAMKIRVMEAAGTHLSITNVTIRNLLRFVDWLPALMFLGAVVALMDPYYRRLGDLAANTMVVRDHQAGLPRSILRNQPRHNSFRTDPALRNRIIARIGPQERDLIMDLALRKDQLDPPVRERMFAEMADHCRKKLGLSDAIGYLSDEQTVLNIALVLQDGWKGT